MSISSLGLPACVVRPRCSRSKPGPHSVRVAFLGGVEHMRRVVLHSWPGFQSCGEVDEYLDAHHDRTVRRSRYGTPQIVPDAAGCLKDLGADE